MAKRRKLYKKLLRPGKLPADARFEEVHLLMDDEGWGCSTIKGTHFCYLKGTRRKTIIADQGRRVKRQYLKRIRDNILREETQ